MRRTARSALGALAVWLATVAVAAAQTSSWSQKVTPEPIEKRPPVAKGAKPGHGTAPTTAAPRVAPGPAIPGKGAPRAVKTTNAPAPSAKTSPIPEAAPAPTKADNDPAYTAFDLGKYLTAENHIHRDAVSREFRVPPEILIPAAFSFERR